MSIAKLASVCLLVLPALTAQNKTLLFTGRFPAVSLDVANERVGGSVTQVQARDLGAVTPATGAYATSWVPTTSHQAFMGDPDAVGNYTKFDGLTTYFEGFHFAGCFVKDGDKKKGDPRLIYYTVRDDKGKGMLVFTNNGAKTHTLLEGDFFRWLSNGDVEFFMTQALFDKAAGLPPAGMSTSPGASAMCQDAAGNLYFSPAGGGAWYHGNGYSTGPEFVNDGAIIMIAAKDITYDTKGNVADLAPDCAMILFGEVAKGPLGLPDVRTMVANAGALDFNGTPIAITANLVGLEIDPNGGSVQASFPLGDPPNQTTQQVPNFIFSFDNGTWGGTIFSTAQKFSSLGSIAVINGVACGSDSTSGVPADGSWLGLKVDTSNFQPTMMGIALIDDIGTPVVMDMPNHGSISLADPTIDWDIQAAPNSAAFFSLSVGPNANGLFAGSFDLGALFPAPGWNTIFTLSNPASFGLGVTSPTGYVSLSIPNPQNPAASGQSLLAHAIVIDKANILISNPVQMQFK